MGTHCRIGLELADHTIISVYCHWDGYPEHTGKLLVQEYDNKEDLEDLIDGGDMSSIRTREMWRSGSALKENEDLVKDAEGYIMYENDREPQPLYYKERGEDNVDPQVCSFDEFVRMEQFSYLYDLNGTWKAYEWRSVGPVSRVQIPGYVTG